MPSGPEREERHSGTEREGRRPYVGLIWPHGAEVVRYMEDLGWVPRSRGEAGALWVRDGDLLAVPSRPNTAEVAGVVQRLARLEGRSPADMATAIRYRYVDVTWFRITSHPGFAESVPFAGATRVLSEALRMLRAAASTAVKTRPRVGNPSARAEQLVKTVRLGYPTLGDFRFPILVPHPIRNDIEIVQLRDENYEPFERRAVRTFGDALHALDDTVLGPAAEPGRDVLETLVERGVSHELCQSLFTVLKDPQIESFEALIDWAPTVKPPSNVPRSIRVDADKADLVKATGDLLRSSPVERARIISGPVVGLERREEGGPGEIKVLAMYNSRERDITVVLPAGLYEQAVDCHRDNRMVLVEGDVVQPQPGRYHVPAPVRFQPLDEGVGISP